MSVHYDHDITRVPPCRMTPREQYLVRPHAPKGAPGLRGQYNSWIEAIEAVKLHVLMTTGHGPLAQHGAGCRCVRCLPLGLRCDCEWCKAHITDLRVLQYTRCRFYDQKCTCGQTANVPSDCT